MRRTVSGLATLAAMVSASVALSGCVIVASEGGESTRIMTFEQAKLANNLGAVRRFSADGAVVQAGVWTNCEAPGSFEVQLADQMQGQDFSIRVRDGAKCEGEMRDLALEWSYQTLGLKSGDEVTLKNPLVL